MKSNKEKFDAIVVGSGIGGLVTASHKYIDAGKKLQVKLNNTVIGEATLSNDHVRTADSQTDINIEGAGYAALKALEDGNHTLEISWTDAPASSTFSLAFAKNTIKPEITITVRALINLATMSDAGDGGDITGYSVQVANYAASGTVAGDKVKITSDIEQFAEIEVPLAADGTGSFAIPAAAFSSLAVAEDYNLKANLTNSTGNTADEVTSSNFTVAVQAASINTLVFGWGVDGLNDRENTDEASKTQSVNTSNMKEGDKLKLTLSKPTGYSSGAIESSGINANGDGTFVLTQQQLDNIPTESTITATVESAAAGGVNGYGNSVSSKVFTFTTSLITVGGDPYVRTLKGELYKLDNITGVCRMLQGEVNGERLVVNTMMKLDSQSTEDEMNSWSESNKVEENESVLEKQSFYTALYVCHGESECVVDLESGEVKVNGDNKMAVEKINAENASLPMYRTERSFGGCSINAGGVKVNCMLYKNKQLRNEISVEGSSLIEKADGYAIRPMRTKECRVKKLRDNRELKMKQSSYKGVVRERFYSKNDKSGKYMNISRV